MKTLLFLAALLLGLPLQAAQLVLDLGNGSRTWQTRELLQLPQARTITVTDDVSYKRDMQYRAVPLAVLLAGIKDSDHLQAVALDGFAAELSAEMGISMEQAQAAAASALGTGSGVSGVGACQQRGKAFGQTFADDCRRGRCRGLAADRRCH